MQRRSFTASSVAEFLETGWMLTLDETKIAVGWGPFQTLSCLEKARELNFADSKTDPESAVLYAPDFYLRDNAPWRVSTNWDLLDRDLFVSHFLAGVEGVVNGDIQGFQWVEPEETLFFSRFETIQRHMHQNGLKKGVPVVFAEAERNVDKATKINILRRLLASGAVPSTLHTYGFWDQDFGMIGTTPEILFEQGISAGSLQGKDELETVALAGTLAKGAGAEGESLLSDVKERAEHQFVIDDLVEALKDFGEVKVGATEVLELPSLFHLKTAIRAELRRSAGFEELVLRLHPTPALGVAPRKLGFAEMLSWDEPLSRGRFGAPFGVCLRNSRGQEIRKCVVAIRNIQWHDRLIRLGSGCGVVAASQASREWQELRAKRDFVKRMLGL